MSSTPISAVVFDLDGTLIDSRRDLAAAINRMRAELGVGARGLEAIVGMVGEGSRELVRRAMADVPGADLEAAFERFRGHYWELCLEQTRPYPGLPELVAACAERWPLAVLTNKFERVSRRILDGLGLSPHFRRVLGGDSLPTRKPDPAGLLRLSQLLGAAIETLWLVGDSRIDAATARAAGSRFAFAGWGFASATEREEIAATLDGADLEAATPTELGRRFGLSL